MKRTPKSTRVSDATPPELTEMAAEFEREFVADTFRAPSPAARAQWQRARRKRGRPRHGAGVKVISVSVEKRLLAAADRLARKRRVSRAQLIARGLRAILAAENAAF